MQLHQQSGLSGRNSSADGQIIPSNFKYFSPQTKCMSNQYDTNSLPRYPYHKNKAIVPVHHRDSGPICEYYRYPIRHPSTPPPPPPVRTPTSQEDQALITTPTSSSSSNDNCSSSEIDPMLMSGGPKRSSSSFDHIPHYRTCKKQIQQATQMLNSQQQYYFENYLHQFSQQSPYRKYLNPQQQQQQSMSPQQQYPPNPQPPQSLPNRQKRHSNVYEYHFNTCDLKSINEDSSNES